MHSEIFNRRKLQLGTTLNVSIIAYIHMYVYKYKLHIPRSGIGNRYQLENSLIKCRIMVLMNIIESRHVLRKPLTYTYTQSLMIFDT